MTTITAQKSTQLTNAGTKPVIAGPITDNAKLRLARFNFKQVGDGDAGSTIDFVKIGPGTVQVMPALSYITGTAFAAGATLDIGHAGYTALDGTAVGAAPAVIAEALAVSSGFDTWLGTGTTAADAAGIPIESKGGVLIQAVTDTAGIPDGATVSGWIAYVRD